MLFCTFDSFSFQLYFVLVKMKVGLHITKSFKTFDSLFNIYSSKRFFVFPCFSTYIECPLLTVPLFISQKHQHLQEFLNEGLQIFCIYH